MGAWQVPRFALRPGGDDTLRLPRYEIVRHLCGKVTKNVYMVENKTIAKPSLMSLIRKEESRWDKLNTVLLSLCF